MTTHFECSQEDCSCHAQTPTLVLNEALAIEPGKTYAIEIPQSISFWQAADIKRQFAQQAGASCVILTGGIRIARDEAGQ